MPLIETLPVGRGVAQWQVWTTTARVVTTDPSASEAAREIIEAELTAVDRAASRFRDDSEVVLLCAAAGRPVRVSPLLAELLSVALHAAEDTDGAVDPTLGSHLSSLGYDRSYDKIHLSSLGYDPSYDRSYDQVGHPADAGSGPAGALTVLRRPTWQDVELDGRTLRLPPGVLLDLGATAKAWAADHCADLVADQLGCGVLVALGGDIAVRGRAPDEGWTILVQDGPDEPASVINLDGARGLATSSTLGRSWERWNTRMHHILDPVTCRPATATWRTVSVAAESCVAANVLTTAAVVRGNDAPGLLRDRGVAARLVRADGSILTLNGWPRP